MGGSDVEGHADQCAVVTDGKTDVDDDDDDDDDDSDDDSDDDDDDDTISP